MPSFLDTNDPANIDVSARGFQPSHATTPGRKFTLRSHQNEIGAYRAFAARPCAYWVKLLFGFRRFKIALSEICLLQIFLFLKDKLKLPINREKSGIRKPVHFEILGHRYVPTYEKGTKGRYQLVVSDKSWTKLKQSLKTITCKTAPLSLAQRIHKLKEVGRGWLNYFRTASITGKLKDLDSWVRNRLRYCIWHDWKKPERRRKNLLRLGVDHGHAFAWSRTRRGGWAVAQSPIMVTTVTLERLHKVLKASLPPLW